MLNYGQYISNYIIYIFEAHWRNTWSVRYVIPLLKTKGHQSRHPQTLVPLHVNRWLTSLYKWMSQQWQIINLLPFFFSNLQWIVVWSLVTVRELTSAGGWTFQTRSNIIKPRFPVAAGWNEETAKFCWFKKEESHFPFASKRNFTVAVQCLLEWLTLFKHKSPSGRKWPEDYTCNGPSFQSVPRSLR